jgi:hypothetical protein
MQNRELHRPDFKSMRKTQYPTPRNEKSFRLCSFSCSYIHVGAGAHQAIGLRNSTPTRWTSPASCWRLTRAWIGAMPAGTKAEEVIEGAGIVRVMTSLAASDRGHVMKAPRALMSKVLANSRNCSPWASLPRTNKGTCRCIRWKRRRSSYIADISVRSSTVPSRTRGTSVVVLM